MIAVSYPITGGDFASAGGASRSLKEQLKRLGVAAEVLRRIMIAAYEAEMNVVIHARSGNLWARLNSGRVDLEVVDQGPGIPDVELAMREGWSTAPEQARTLGFGAGMGLPNIRRASDLFEIDTRVGKGTRIRSTIFLRKLDAAGTQTNSIAVQAERCRGCLDCVAACPTRALRLRSGRPVILEHLCIDCTACLAACRCGGLVLREEEKAEEGLAGIEALVLPQGALFGFPQAEPTEVLEALAAAGCAEVRLTEEWEAGLARETLRWARAGQPVRLPALSPACPAVVNWIQTQFPSLLPQLAPYCSPVEAARGELSLRSTAIVAACPAQHTVLESEGLSGRLRVLSPARFYQALQNLLARNPGPAAGAGKPAWAPPGRPLAAPDGAILRITGASHVQRALEQTEAGKLKGVEVLELFFCDEGCWGSPLLPEDPYVARHRAGDFTPPPAPAAPRPRPYLARPGLRLDEDMVGAMRKLAAIDELTRRLPGRDCRLCGSPSCAALAEDIVLGRHPGPGCPMEEEP